MLRRADRKDPIQIAADIAHQSIDLRHADIHVFLPRLAHIDKSLGGEG